MVFETEYASDRQLISWVLSWRENARLLDPPELAAEADERLALLRDRHRDEFEVAKTVKRPLAEGANGRRNGGSRGSNGRAESVIRPERFARLVTLAGLLIGAARDEGSLPTKQVLDELNISLDELREDLDVLNVVNFGGGTYVLYAEIDGDRIEVDPDTYGDNFARPARLLPLEAKALVAAIDLFGDHLPQSGLQTARNKIIAALGHDPSEEGLEIAPGRDDSSVVRTVNDAISAHRVLELKYYKENEDDFVTREVEPYQLVKGPEGWYLGCFDLGRSDTRHFRLDRMKEALSTDREFEPREGVEEMLAEQEWLVHGEVTTAGVARVWVAPERARWLREQRTVVEELSDGAVVVELPYGSERLAGPRGAQGRRRPGRARADRGARGRAQGRRRLTPRAGPRGGAGASRDRPDRRPEPGADDARRAPTPTWSAERPAYVIDPGPGDPGHLDRVREAAEAGGGIAGVLLTHGHSDHSEGVEALGGELLWGRASWRPTRWRRSQAALEAGSASALEPAAPGRPRRGEGDRSARSRSCRPPATPPTTSAFCSATVCFCGDLILGSGSTIVPPAAGGGSLADYMRSLERLDALGAGAARPGPRPVDHRPGGEDRRVPRAPARARAAPASRRSNAASARAPRCSPRSGTTSPRRCAPPRRSRCRRTSRSSRPRAGSTRPELVD